MNKLQVGVPRDLGNGQTKATEYRVALTHSRAKREWHDRNYGCIGECLVARGYA
jgi:hypothetical protein